MEKLKDIIHDFTDIILAIVIAISMFLVVNWHLGSWFPGNTAIAANTTPIQSETQSDDIIEEEIDDQEEEQEVSNEQPTPPVESDFIVVDNIKITIPEGSTGHAIGRILKENGLVEEISEFINEAERLRLTSRLQSGTFQIPENASLEHIVKIISRQIR